MSSLSRCGMFSCPSGANVSWSRAPPPNVITTTLCFLRAASARTSGLAPSNAVPSVTPATSRKKSRRVRLRSHADTGLLSVEQRAIFPVREMSNDARSQVAIVVERWSFTVSQNFRTWLSKQTVALPLVLCPLRLGVENAISGRLRILPWRGLFERGARSPFRGDSGRQRGSGPVVTLVHIPEPTSHTDADRHRDFRVACGVRQAYRPIQSRALTATRFREYPGRHPPRVFPSRGSSHSNTERGHSRVEAVRSVEIARSLLRPGWENCRKPEIETD